MVVDSFKSDSGNCQGEISTNNNWNITVTGTCKVAGCNVLRYEAAAPADLRMSYMGSGLPYPNKEVACQGSPNKGEVRIRNGKFTFQLISPNYYYKDNGSTLVSPHVEFTVGRELFDVPLPSAYRFTDRSLTSMPGRTNRATGR